jgi:hypothetical protein
MNKRLFQLAGPPLLALLGAVLYTNHRLTQAEVEVAGFCATIAKGMPARTFIERALAANFEVHDFGAESTTLIASTTVFAWKKETFECRAERDTAGVVRSTHTARRAE